MGLNMRGRHYRWHKKDTTDSHLAFDIATFAKAVDLTTVRTGSWQWTYSSGRQSTMSYTITPGEGVQLAYTSNGESFNYRVRLATTTPHYGGVRYWWLCPHCDRRVRILFGGQRFLCRHCHNLTYETAQKGDLLTTIDHRLCFIRRKLQGQWHFLHGPGDKPNGMHWDTYNRWMREYFNLLRMRSYALGAEIASLASRVGDATDNPVNTTDIQRDIQAAWQFHKAQPDWAVSFSYRSQATYDDEANDVSRLTLGDIAQRAGVPYAFAVEAQQVGLIRADQGRGKRRRRYRERLKNWLYKLYKLRDKGMTWEDIIAWSKRRFQPGHEHERVWPAGIEEKKV